MVFGICGTTDEGGNNMGRKKKIEPDDPAQFARFIEASEKIEFVENPKETFEQAFKKVAKAKPRNKEKLNS